MRSVRVRALPRVALGAVSLAVLAFQPRTLPAQADSPVEAAGAGGSAVDYRISAADTRIVILVYRAGVLARLGHNHVISTTEVEGAVHFDGAQGSGRFVLEVPVETLEVDNPQLRELQDETFDTEPSAANIAGTRDNMLGPQLLESAAYPTVTVRGAAEDLTRAAVTFQVKEHSTEEIVVPLEVTVTEPSIRITGTMELTHQELGLTPFSALGGALRVAEVMDVHFDIRAVRESD